MRAASMLFGVSLGKLNAIRHLVDEDRPMPIHGNAGTIKDSTQKEEAILWWHRYVETNGEQNPTEATIHLPACLSWTDIHEEYVRDVGPENKPLSFKTLMTIRRVHFPHVRHIKSCH